MSISVLKTIPTSALVVALSLLGTLTLRADPGVFDDRIVFGQSAALKGPAAALGLGMREGIVAALPGAHSAEGLVQWSRRPPGSLIREYFVPMAPRGGCQGPCVNITATRNGPIIPTKW